APRGRAEASGARGRGRSCCNLQSGRDLQEAALERDALGLEAVDVDAGLDEAAVDRRRVARADAQSSLDGLDCLAGEEGLGAQVVARRDEHGLGGAGELVDRA